MLGANKEGHTVLNLHLARLFLGILAAVLLFLPGRCSQLGGGVA